MSKGNDSGSSDSAHTPLHAIDACPRRDECEDASHEVNQDRRRVALVPSRHPQLIQARASDDCMGEKPGGVGGGGRTRRCVCLCDIHNTQT